VSSGEQAPEIVRVHAELQAVNQLIDSGAGTDRQSVWHGTDRATTDGSPARGFARLRDHGQPWQASHQPL